MRRWLFKSDPETYAFSQLKRDRKTVWDGVANPLARIHLRSIERGDSILFYHSGNERAVVGVMTAISGPKPDPASNDLKAVVVEVKFAKEFATPVTLEQIKNDSLFADWDLLRQHRLSVLPVNEKHWARIEQLSKK